LIVSEFVSLDGVIQAPGGKDEDRDGGFEYGGWTWPYWHDDIGGSFAALMKDCDAFLLGRRTYLTHAAAFEPMPAGDFFGDMMNAPKKYVVSRTLDKPTWRNTTIIRDNVIEAIRALKGGAGQEHPHGWEQRPRSRPRQARPGRRAPFVALPADARRRKTIVARRRARDVQAGVGESPIPPVSSGSITSGR
jgi:dihydrofolate reductase